MMTNIQITLLQPKQLASFFTAIISTMHPLPRCLCQNNITWQYKGFSFIVCLTIVTLILIATFRPHTAVLHQAILSIYWVELFVPLWLSVYHKPCSWLSETIRQHDNRPLAQRTAEGSVSSSHNANNALDRNPPTMCKVCDTPITNNHGGTNSLTQ